MLTVQELTNQPTPALVLVHMNADKHTIVLKNTDPGYNALYIALSLHTNIPIKISTQLKEAVQIANEHCGNSLCTKYLNTSLSLQDILRDLLTNEDFTFDNALDFIKHYKQTHLHTDGETLTILL